MINLDNNATTKPLPEVVEAVTQGLTEFYHNPSSVHRGGQNARYAVELARAQLAELVGVKPRDLVLTGSGTESIDLAIRGVIGSSKRPVLITDDAEHAAVRDLAASLERDSGVEVRKLPVLGSGLVDAKALTGLLEPDDAAIVSVQWVNNETGIIQPVDQIHDICKEWKVAFHCDGTQWVGKAPVPKELPCDLLTFSPHKFHGPKGVGCLWVRRGVRLRPTLQGSQELGRRGGTENVPGILGAGVAAETAKGWLSHDENRTTLGQIRDRFEREVIARCPGALVNGMGSPRIWNTTNIGFPRLEAEILLLALSERGVYASAGAACSSGSLDPSPVLLAMGIAPEVAHGSIRFSLSRYTTDDQIGRAIGIVTETVKSIGGMHALA